MPCPLLQPSWIEQTMDLCDQIILKAAKANPANQLLCRLLNSIRITRDPDRETKPSSSSQPLAS